MISLLIPTRKRTKDLCTFLDSIHETCRDSQNIEILIRIDDDDSETIEFVKEYNENSVLLIKSIIRPRIGYINVADMYRELYQISKGDILYFLADDTKFVTKYWDKKILDTYNNVFDDNIYTIKTSLNDKNPDDLLPCFPAVTREWYEILGCAAPTLSPDSALYFLNKLINREVFLNEIIVLHNHTDLLTGNKNGELDTTLIEGRIAFENENIAFSERGIYSPQGCRSVVDAAIKISSHIKSSKNQKCTHLPMKATLVHWRYLFKFKLYYYIYFPRIYYAIKYYNHYFLGSSKFCVSDLKDSNGLAIRLCNAQDSRTQYLREHFSTQTQQLLNEFDSSKPISKALKKALVNELNQALGDGRLYSEQYSDCMLQITPEMRKLINQNPKGNDLIRLNRLLLEATFPYEIMKAHISKFIKK